MISIINRGSKYAEELSNALQDIACPHELIPIEELERRTYTKGVIVPGAPVLLTETDRQREMQLYRFLMDETVPVLGICYGHQILGLLFGSRIFKKHHIHHIERVEFLKENPLFEGVDRIDHFAEDHSECITLPEGFHRVASSKSCENEAMHFRNFYGVQFHPEISGDSGKKVLKNFVRLCHEYR